MNVYPDGIVSFRTKSNLPGLSYEPTDERTIFAEDFTNIENEVIAIEETLGEEVQGPYPTTADRLSAIENIIPSAIGAALELIYPVGTIYSNTTDDTNPGTLFGFGTWVPFAQGRVPVGVATSGTFAVVGATGGEETHTLTISEMPSHNHAPASGTNFYHSGISRANPGSGVGSFDFGVAQANTGSRGGSAAHNNLQPYVVVYMWERTA